jgi:hypothetical protein
MIYRVGARSSATAATANHVAAQLWNPSSGVPLWVREIHVASVTAAVSNTSIARSNARGATPTTTTTPDIDSDSEKALAPPSGAVLETATFGTQPTLDTPALESWNLPAVIGAGMMFVFGERGRGAIKVPPGAGLCVYTPVAVALVSSDFTFVWEE